MINIIHNRENSIFITKLPSKMDIIKYNLVNNLLNFIYYLFIINNYLFFIYLFFKIFFIYYLLIINKFIKYDLNL